MGELRRILHLEDNRASSQLIRLCLEQENIQVEHTANYDEALLALLGLADYSGLENYDALLLDFMVPATGNRDDLAEKLKVPSMGNGLDIARAARNAGYKGNIVIFTARMEEELDIPEDLDIKYLKKPCETDEIINALKKTHSDKPVPYDYDHGGMY